MVEMIAAQKLSLVAGFFLALTTLAFAQSTKPNTSTAPNRSEDWPDLGRYREANRSLAAPQANENRVVFLGDSITDFWGHAPGSTFFPGKPYVNRGISGQTTPQMLVRFRADVVALQPKVVVILAGTNDLAGNTGPMTLEDTKNNLMSMADIARQNHIAVVLASVTPASAFPWRPGSHPAADIRALNAWIIDYSAKQHLVYADYYSALVDANGGMKADFSKDGVHPNADGYRVMASIAQRAIASALR